MWDNDENLNTDWILEDIKELFLNAIMVLLYFWKALIFLETCTYLFRNEIDMIFGFVCILVGWNNWVPKTQDWPCVNSYGGSERTAPGFIVQFPLLLFIVLNFYSFTYCLIMQKSKYLNFLAQWSNLASLMRQPDIMCLLICSNEKCRASPINFSCQKHST